MTALLSAAQRIRTHLASAAVVLAAALALGGGATGCAHVEFFPGTHILKTADNRAILDTIEEYRRRLVERNSEALMLLASERYWEDSGTPRSDDDYGYEGLRQVLYGRLQRVKSIWYEIELRDMHVKNDIAEVNVYLNGSFELDIGERHRHISDYHRFMLERKGDGWRFLSGM